MFWLYVNHFCEQSFFMKQIPSTGNLLPLPSLIPTNFLPLLLLKILNLDSRSNGRFRKQSCEHGRLWTWAMKCVNGSAIGGVRRMPCTFSMACTHVPCSISGRCYLFFFYIPSSQVRQPWWLFLPATPWDGPEVAPPKVLGGVQQTPDWFCYISAIYDVPGIIEQAVQTI